MELEQRLLDAVVRDDAEAAREAVVLGADVNAHMPPGRSILASAAFSSSEVLAAVLAGSPDQLTLDEALRWIVTLHRVDQVELLLAHGADPDCDTGEPYSRPIWQICFARESSPDVLRLLLDRGIDTSVRDESGAVPAASASLALQAVFVERGSMEGLVGRAPPSGYVGPWPWWRTGDPVDGEADYRFAWSHPEPGEAADFLVAAQGTGVDGDYGVEQLWARQLDDHRFEIASIPWGVEGLSRGDVVRTAALGGCPYVVVEILRSSDRVGYQVERAFDEDLDLVRDAGLALAVEEVHGAGGMNLAIELRSLSDRISLETLLQEHITRSADVERRRWMPTRWRSRPAGRGMVPFVAEQFRWAPP